METKKGTRKASNPKKESGINGWIGQETKACEFKDVRLGERYVKLLEQMSKRIGSSIPLACEDWAATKAAYRFLANGRVSEAEILGGHFKNTQQRYASSGKQVLVLHDTTELSFTREDDCGLGLIGRPPTGGMVAGRPRLHTLRGILMHSSLALTAEGLPLGLAAVKFWSRKKFKGCNALKRKINPTRVPIEKKESIRWLENLRQSTELLGRPEDCVHIGDRESDIYELFCTARDVGTHFLVRTCVDRLAGEGNHTIATEMKKADVQGEHRLVISTKGGDKREVVLEIKYKKVCVLPPIGKQKQYPSLTLTVLHAVERKAPRGQKRLEWKLITDLPIDSLAQAIEKLEWYAMRWKIETFHKILKSGCKAEESKLRSAESLVKLISIYAIVSWRILWMTMLQRTDPESSADLALTSTEKQILERLVPTKGKVPTTGRDLLVYLNKIARLGGYLGRASDPPPGNMVMWRGMSRLNDIHLGFALGANFVGN